MDNMNENLNLTEILKDCPKGTKFYSRCLGSVEFCKITLDNYIEVTSKNGCYIRFKPNGIYQHSEETAEIDLFPSKDQRDWNKWNRPFINGDIVFYNDTIAIFKEWGDETLFRTYITKYLCCDSLIDMNVPLFGKSIRKEIRFATEKEKQILFDAIKEYGYKWNAETKTLEKLIEPKFKVRDKIIHKSTGIYCTLGEYAEGISAYHTNIGLSLTPKDLEQWELMPNKFDPKTLQPFDKVLVRDIGCETRWHIQFFETMNECTKKYPFMCLGGKIYSFCIPYNNNTKHLIGKSEEAPEFYRYWEE